MLLEQLIEDAKDLKSLAKKTMGPSPQERAIAQRMVQAKQMEKTVKKARSKSFKMNFKDEKGYYKVQIKSTDKGIKYSYGYHDQSTMPSVKLENLTEDAKKKYEEFKAYLSAIKKGSNKSNDKKRKNT